MTLPARLRPTPWLLERTITALMVGSLLLAILIVGWRM